MPKDTGSNYATQDRDTCDEGRARSGALAREVIIEAVSAIQHNTHPRLMEQQLGAFLRLRHDARGREVAA